MPFVAIIPALTVLVGDALTATGAVVNCYVLNKCGRSLNGFEFAHLPRQVGLCNVPQFNFDQCQAQLRTVTVATSIPAPGTAQFDNVPPACMDLSTVLLGGCGVSGPNPTVCGSACLSYSGLSDSQMTQLSQALAPFASG